MNTKLTILVIAIAALLIVGQQFGFEFAGGDGYRSSLAVQTTNQSFKRGETIETADSPEVAIIGDATIVLDARTTLVLERLFQDDLQFHLTRGRIVVDSPTALTINTNFTKNTLLEGGRASFVNFDFLEQVSVIPLETTVVIETGNTQRITTIPLNIHETGNPITFDSFEFDPTKDSIKDFYEFAGDTLSQ